ncbi:MAG: FAD:protein FMN transferase [Actinobacteria bacterium]|nr:FAD:protein FMN transferase [Actinomycetota bacterium]
MTERAWEWRATGTIWRLHHDGMVDASLAEAAARLVAEDERRWSRFLPSSEVCAVTAGAGTWVPVSLETLELLGAALAWRELTGGVFEPLVGGPLAAWGYGRSLREARLGVDESPDARAIAGSLELDVQRCSARIPAGTLLDVHGIAKGWMADRVARLVAPAGGRVLVDAGGDLVAASGDHVVAVADDPGTWIAMAEGLAVATSAAGGRGWRNGDGRVAHHLIDPETGAPAAESSATVVAASAEEADVLAKVLALRPERLGALDRPAVVRDASGVRANDAWAQAAVSEAERPRPARLA